MSIVLFIVFAVVVLILVSGGYVFHVACVRREELLWLVEEEIKKTSYGKYYEHMCRANQWLFDHHAQDVYITSHDGLKLHGLWIEAENPKGTILLAHGYRSTMLADFGIAFDCYHKLGMNILVPEQRAHGKSEGKYITFGVKESKDMADWICYHNEKFGNYQMIISGLSMGATTMLFLADQQLPDNVKGIIADCGFTSAKQILSTVFTRVTHLPAQPTIFATNLFARIFAGFGLSQKDTRKTLKNSRLPVFMIHGTDDDFVPCDMTRQGYAACTGEKTLLLVEGADHGTSFLKDRATYESMINAFLSEYVVGFSK